MRREGEVVMGMRREGEAVMGSEVGLIIMTP